MENAHEINLSKKECMKETVAFIKDLHKGKIEKETDSSITFKKGNFWSLETSTEKTVIRGIINFEGNGQTKIKTRPDNTNIFLIDLLLSMIVILIFFIIIGISVPFLKDLEYTNYLNGEITYDTYVIMFNYLNVATLVIFILIPIILVPLMLYTYLYLKPKSLKIITEQLISKLKTRSQEIIQQERVVKSEKTIVQERIKVIYDLPEKCPSCNVPLKYESIKMRGPNKAECGYCNSMFDLIEKEI